MFRFTTTLFILLPYLFLGFCSEICSAQTKYFYLKFDEKSKLPSSGYYQILYPDSLDSKRHVIEFYSYDDKLIKVIPYLDNAIDGTVYAFDSLGKLQFETNYIAGVMSGFYQRYWPDGKLKRKDLYIDGKLVSGKCYNKSGKEMKYREEYTDFVIGGGLKDLNSYILSRIQRPYGVFTNDVKGTVIVKMTITEFCEIEDVSITKSVSETIDLLAMDLLKKMPIESPQIKNGIPERVTLWIPIYYGSFE